MKARTKPVIRIGLAGDTMLGRMVSKTLLTERMPRIGTAAYRDLWGTVLPHLKKNDLNVVNLETTFTRSTNVVPKVFNFKSDPNHVRALQEANIEVVSIANNHIGDFGQKGLSDTIATLDKAGILHVGAGYNKAEARAPVIVERDGIRIGIIGATDNEPDWQATANQPGTSYFSTNQMEQLLADIKALAQQVDIVIISLQWGPNKRQRPTADYVQAAHAMVDAGADIIHGHSAHIFQGIETYKGSLILYDTGDFIDDYAVYPDLRNDQSFLFIVHADSDGVQKLELIPTRIENMQVNVAQPDEARQIVKRMQKLSTEFATSVMPYDNVQRATVTVGES